MSVTSGWGRFTWGQAYWNADTTLKTGWGAQAWNGDGEWGELKDAVAQPTGLSITSSVGSPTVDIPDVIITPTGFELLHLHKVTAFNPVVVSGISASFSVGSLTVDDVHQGLTSINNSFCWCNNTNDLTIGLTGQSITVSQGTAKAPNQTAIVSGQSMTSSQGTAARISSQEAQLTGQSITSSLGSCYNTKCYSTIIWCISIV